MKFTWKAKHMEGRIISYFSSRFKRIFIKLYSIKFPLHKIYLFFFEIRIRAQSSWNFKVANKPERCQGLVAFFYFCFTFIAIPDGEEVDIVRVSFEEEQRDPAVASVYRHDEQDAHYPTLLRWVRVPTQVLVNLQCTTN